MQEALGAAASNKNMVVAVRVRPLSQKETAAGHKQCCNLLSDKIVVISKEQQAKYLRSQKGSCNEYAFDAAFDERSTQREVYEATTKPFMAKLVDGYNVTVFAYGATGAGKTHTMMGNTRCDDSSSNADAGIIPNALKDVFHLIEQEKRKTEIGVKWAVGVTFIEVYNEQVYDLLQPMGKCLPLREDKVKGVVEIAGVAERAVDGPNEVLELLQQGNRYRKTEATMANQVSSRSHAVLQLMVRRTRTTTGGREAMVESRLSLIDLAGSERASATQNRGARLNEGANINKSLLALANCINALSEKTNGKPKSVKFRDSKLTHLLRSSLEGNCSLIMIANINPSDKTFEDSHNTLKYANRAKNIKVDPTVTDVVKESNWVERESRLREENEALRSQVALLMKQMQMLHESGEADFHVAGCSKSIASLKRHAAAGSLPAVPSSARVPYDFDDDGMDVVSEQDLPMLEPHPPSIDERMAAPISSRTGAYTRRHMFKQHSGASEEQADLSIDLKREKTPRSARKRAGRHNGMEADKSLFTLGAAFTISKDDETHELMDTTAEGRAALLPKYSVSITDEHEYTCASPVPASNQEQAGKNEVVILRRSARKKQYAHDESFEELPKYSVRITADAGSPEAERDGLASVRRSARKRPREEMSKDEFYPSSRGIMKNVIGKRDIGAGGLGNLMFLSEQSRQVESDELPVTDFLDDMHARSYKKRRGSGIPLRNSAASASTSVLPSSNSKVHSSNAGPETDVTVDESFLLGGRPDLVPLHSAKGSKPFIIGAATSYYNKVAGKKTDVLNFNCENIQKGSSKVNPLKTDSIVPGKVSSERKRAPLGNYLTNKISGQRKNIEITPL